MKFICTVDKWKQLGQPDLNSIIYLRDRKTSKKVYFIVIGIDYGNKKGIKLTLIKKQQQ